MKKSRLLIVATALILTVLMVASVCIFASSESTAKLTVDASGGKVKVLVDDELKSHGTSTVALKVALGSTVKLVVEDNTEGFQFWTDSALNTCSEATTYTFTMVGDASYTAWFAASEGSLVVYRNDNTSKQVLASAEYASTATFTKHLVDSAVKFAHTFKGWSLTPAEIQTKIAAGEKLIVVAPTYTANVSSYTINVSGGKIQETSATTGSYAYGDKITLVADAAPSGQSFSAWKNSAGVVISTSSTLQVTVGGNETFTAVFSAETVTYEPATNLSIVTDKQTGALVSTAYIFVPSGNTLGEYGLIYSKNVKCAEYDLILENVDGQAIKKAAYTQAGGVLVNYFSEVESVSARSYIVYTDASGVQHTIYSDVVFAAYDDTILKLEIGDTAANSKNASATGPALNLNTQAKGTVSVVKDTDLDKNVLQFTGGGAWQVTTSYSLSTVGTDIDADLANGFTIESLFKPTATYSSYTGVIDYEELGGVGLMIYQSTTGKAYIKLEIAYTDSAAANGYSWVTLEEEVDLNQWYHVVCTYDGIDTVKLYINGKNTDIGTLPNVMHPVKFTSGDAHVCVGSCAQTGTNTDRCGFTGSLAVANIFSTPVTDTNKIAKMYAKAMAPDEDTSVDTETETTAPVTPPTQSEQEIINELLNLKHELRVDENGDFRVVIFSDVQCSNAALNTETLNNIKIVIDREQPDLVLFAGDNLFDIYNEADLRTYIGNMVSYIEQKKIPWAHVFGNHDDETAIGEPSVPKARQHEIYMEFEYCISKDVLYGYDGEEIFGVGNYVLPVLTNDGSKIAFNIWALDSGQYDHAFNSATDNIVFDGNGFYGHYQSMEKNQVDWYYETSKLLEKYNGGETIPAMLYQHIPLQETYFAYKYGTNKTGTKGENISAHPENVGLFSAILDRGDIKLIAHGHDHKNDFTADYKGVTFAYTACAGTEEYHDDSMVGGRVVDFSTKDTSKLDTYMSYIIERDPGEDILKLEIADDNTVSNASASRPVLNAYNPTSGATMSVTTDATINRKFIKFAGKTSPDASSNYWMSMDSINASLLSDGFAIETMFRATAKPSSGYVGIIDYCEAGGFGLNYYSNGDLRFDMGHSTSGYTSIIVPINLNEWYHVVVDYNATTLKLTMYINGVQVAQEDVTTGYRAPGFWGTPANYISIGACADSEHYGELGFTGDIAIANVYVASKTSDEAIKLYNKVKAESFTSDGTVLKLTIDDSTVTNASATGPVLIPYSNNTYTTSIVTDAALNRKAIRFVGGDGNPATYRIYPETLETDFANGFAYEVLFKPTSTAFVGSTSYVGILDYDEANGGFGLRGVKTSETQMGLQATIATSDSATIKNISLGNVTVGEWCHVVFSFDGTNINIWVNGENVHSAAAGGTFRTAVFGSAQPYICVGAAAWGTSKGIYGFIGDIATCNIYSNAVNATKAAELYNATGLN